MLRKITTILVLIFILNVPMVLATDNTSQEVVVGDYFYFGKYGTGETKEDILWRVIDIDNDKVLLFSDEILCYKPFDEDGTVSDTDVVSSHQRGYKRNQSGSNYWADSNIRSWLNSAADYEDIEWECGVTPSAGYTGENGFLSGFTQAEIDLIEEVSQPSILDQYEYSDMTPYGTESHTYKPTLATALQNFDTTAFKETVEDKVFLLDIKQIQAVSNLFEDENYHIITTGSNNTQKRYWLRTPATGGTMGNENSTLVRNITSTGKSEFNNAVVRNGVRPTLYLSTSAVIDSGEGTKANPFRILAFTPVSVNLQATATVPEYEGDNPSGWAFSTVSDKDGKILDVFMQGAQFQSNAQTTVTVNMDNVLAQPGHNIKLYAWDGDLTPLVNKSIYKFAMVNSQIVLISVE